MKRLTQKQASALSRKAKEHGKVVVTINGSYDLVHAGHIFAFNEAKKQGDVLIVGLNSDRSVRSYKHGMGPIIDQEGRAILLESLEMIDHIVIFDEPDPIEFIRAIAPDVHCNAASYGKDCVEAGIVKQVGGRLHMIPDDIGGNMKYSSSNIADRIYERHKPKQKFVIFDRDGVLNVDVGYTHKIDDFVVPKNTVEGIRLFRDAGYKFIIITNQSGMARGMYGRSEFDKFMQNLEQYYESEGIRFESTYHCPHHPKITGDCDCRKPAAGMFRKAIKEHNIDLEESISIGDSHRDTEAAKKAGIGTTVLLLTKEKPNGFADFESYSMLDAANLILKSK